MAVRNLLMAAILVLAGAIGGPAVAQPTNLEAGKSPSQIFSGTCTACHKSARGLLKSVSASSLPSFLRQHYTTSGEMASVLSAYLVSNGAADTRYTGGGLTKQGKEAATEPKPNAPPDQLDRNGRRQRPSSETQQAARPDADGLNPNGESPRQNRKRRPENPDEAKPGEAKPSDVKPGEAKPAEAKPADGKPAEAAEAGSKLGKRQRLSKRGKPSETPAPDAGKSDGAADAGKDTAKTEPSAPGNQAAKPDAGKPDDEKSAGKPDATKSAAAKSDDTVSTQKPTALRSDPVPPVTPAPSGAEAAKSEPTAASGGATAQTAQAPRSDEPARVAPEPAERAEPPAPPQAPVAPAGAPTPPISQ